MSNGERRPLLSTRPEIFSQARVKYGCNDLVDRARQEGRERTDGDGESEAWSSRRLFGWGRAGSTGLVLVALGVTVVAALTLSSTSTTLHSQKSNIGGSRGDTAPALDASAAAGPVGGRQEAGSSEMWSQAPYKSDSTAREHGLGSRGKKGRQVSRGQSKNGAVGDTGTKPNVFMILIDDMGWNDIGYQSTDLSAMTPRLDALAAGGVKLSNYYSMSLCTPARASLMTGRYPVRYGMQYFVIQPGAPWGLPLSEKVMPEYMNDAGYESHMVGKWHIGSYAEDMIPHRRGFNTFLGYLYGIGNYWTHKNTEAFLDNETFYDFGWGNETGYYDVTNDLSFLGPSNSPAPLTTMSNTVGSMKEIKSTMREEPTTTARVGQDAETSWHDHDEGAKEYTGTYSEDVFVGRAMRIIENKTPWDDEPLFLYLAHQSVHQPIAQPPTDAFTNEELELLKAVESDSPIRVRFSGSLLYLDKKIGELIDKLEAGGWMENSIIAVASDNGGCVVDGGTNYPLRGGKQSMFEGGTRVPAFVYSKSHIPEELWGTTYGGIMHVTDWVPTFASAAGGVIRGSAGPLDGVDHWASLTTLEGQQSGGPRTEMLYNWDQYLMSSLHGLRRNDSLAQGAFRQGKWKLIANGWCSGYYSYDPKVQDDPLFDGDALCNGHKVCLDCNDFCQEDTEYPFADWLFDLEADPRESNNVIHEYPEIATRLRQRVAEVVYSDCVDSIVQDVDEGSYQVWAANNWWMIPWWKHLGRMRLTGQLPKKNLVPLP